MKENLKIICPICKRSETKKYGKRNDVQRYQCKYPECKHTFLEIRKRVAYHPNEKAVLSMLINILKPDEEGRKVTVEDAIANIDVDNINVNKFRFIQRAITDTEKIECYNPRLLICDDFDNITIYKFEKRQTKEEKSRTITIIDDDNNSKIKNIFKDKIKKEKATPKKRRPKDIYLIKLQNEIAMMKESESKNDFGFYDEFEMQDSSEFNF